MKTTHSRPAISLAIALAFSLTSACGGTTSAKPDDPTSDSSKTADGAKSGGTSSKSNKPASNKKLKLPSVSPRAVTSLSFVAGKLAIGFSDGAIAQVELEGGKVMHAKVAKSHAVAAVAPQGDLALLASSPPVIVNTKGDLILQMNTVPSFESAVFGPDGVTLFVADKAGKVRIWGQAHSFEEDQHKEKLEDYLNRQAPDFHVEFPPVSGPIHVTDSGKLIVVDKEGNVRIWDPTRPSASKRIMKVGGGARSIASADGHVFVTSMTGAFKVGVDDGSGFLPWSKDARAAFVAASPMSAGTYYTLDNGKLEGHKTETGDADWSVELPDGHACGLAISADGNTLAACIGNFVATFDARNGGALAHGYRADGDFKWIR